jgi:hypothetical protein
MRHNPSIDMIAETYMNQVSTSTVPGVVMMDVSTGENSGGCPHAAQGCTCGGCPECSAVESGQQQEHDPTEIKMALAELMKAKEYAGKLEEMLQSAHGLEGWTAAKITKASDYLSSVYHWLEYESGGESCGTSQYNIGHADTTVDAHEDGE